MPSDRISGRALAAALGVSEKAVRKAALAGRIPLADSGFYDLEACRMAWGSATDPARSKVRTSADHGGPQSTPGPQVRSKVRTTRSAPLPPANTAALWAALDWLVALVPWAVAEHGGELQLAFDVHADLSLDLPAELQRRGFTLPGALEVVDWDGLAEAHSLDTVGLHGLTASYARRRAEG